MTDTHPSDAPGAHVCPHCDATHEHDHIDERAVVAVLRSRLLRYAGVRIAVGVLALATAALLGPSLLIASAAAALAWALVTAIGMTAATIDLAHKPSDGRSRAQESRFVLVSVLIGAALAPVAALGLALLAPLVPTGSPQPHLAWALAGAAGWFAGAAGAEVVAELRLRHLLGSDTRPGEVARENAVRLREHTREGRILIAVLATAGALGLEILLCLWMPVVVVVLIPLHVAVAALAGRWHARHPLPSI
ncbi:hypothetical protein [Ruania halotolerans]|uniref:hypothetical protein n=1 Tax=Ruania halotolerans TaxID=2897773 RepID=UPI001E4566D7|nr:hypothetical protein [Ruania halotolerans]UFU05299.1 hypothetical protein LQF10_12625 [Ruania halotolerans]